MRVRPLLKAGWHRCGSYREPSSWELGDFGFYNFERDDLTITVGCHENGRLIAWGFGDDAPAVFTVDDSTPDSSRLAFELQGWLVS